MLELGAEVKSPRGEHVYGDASSKAAA